jgi:hypothetical protein
MNAKYDIRRIRAELNLLSAEIQAMKKSIRQPNHLPSCEEYQLLRSAQYRVTRLCCLRAHHRERFHLMDREKSLALALALEPEYVLQKSEAA